MRAVLETDSKFRYPGVTGDLFTEETVNLTPDPDIENYFMIKAPNWSIPKKYQTHQDVNIIKRYIRSSSWSCLDSLDYSNIIIAGGAVSRWLAAGPSYWAYDVDIFLYGLNQEQADGKVRQIIRSIKSKATIVSISKLMNVISIKVNASGDDGDENPEETDSSSSTVITESDHDEGAMSTEVSPHRVAGESDDCQLTVNKGSKQHADIYEIQIILRIYSSISEILHGFDLGSSAVGYDGTHIYFTSLSQYAYANAVNIVDTTRRSMTYEGRLCKYIARGFRILLPNLDKNKIEQKAIQKIDLPFMSMELKKNNGTTLVWTIPNMTCGSDYETSKGNRLMTQVLSNRWSRDYIGIMDPARMTSILNKCRKAICDQYFKKSTLSTDTVCHLFGQETALEYLKDRVSVKEKMDGLLALDPSVVVTNYLVYARSSFFPLKWMTVNPATQLTGSFNPIIADPRDWYGEWYYDPEIPTAPSTLTDDEQCCICYKRKSNKILVPCGHTRYCEECLTMLQFKTVTKTCSICRQKVKNIITVY